MFLAKYQLIIFDLDGTLAPSKSAIEPDMAELLFKLVSKVKVAVISGGAFHQFETQFLNRLPINAAGYSNLLLLPTSGTRMYVWRGRWHEEYAEDLTPAEKERVGIALKESLKMSGFVMPEKVFGQQTEDRGSQITFSAVGQNAPLEIKATWDPDRKKRQHIANILSKKLPNFDIRLGGMTSIDITRRGVNKGYGIRKLEERLNLDPEDILFVGDALYHGGNDYPARATGVDCLQVKDPAETKQYIRQWLEETEKEN